jgi:hypothetical protein
MIQTIFPIGFWPSWPQRTLQSQRCTIRACAGALILTFAIVARLGAERHPREGLGARAGTR